MSDKILTFYGSDEDLDDLRKMLTDAGFKEHQDTMLHASGDIIPTSIAFLTGVGVGSCVRTYLRVRGKRMVSRFLGKNEKKTVIRGDFSADEIERLLKIPYNIDIEDEKDDA